MRHYDSMLSTEIENPTALIPLLVADVFQLAGAFRKLGSRLASRVGQTQARWQVLSVLSGGPHTVAQIARRLGYARQSVQRTADQLVKARLARYEANPDHKTSPLVEITEQGASTLARITREAEKWHVQLASELKPSEVAGALRTVRQLCSAVEAHLK